MSQPYKTAPYKIAYVASLTHSGSTLLDLLVSGHSQVTSVGEVFQLADYAHARRAKNERTRFGNECTCGAETIWRCDFWPRVDEAVREASGRGLRDLDVEAEDPAAFRTDNKLLFDAVAKVTGARVIVDSSKLQKRLRMLIEAGFAPVAPIHLMRDPRGQVYSVIRRTKQTVLRPSLRYALETARTFALLRERDHIDVSYENLVADPRRVIERVMGRLGLPFEPAQLDWTTPGRHNLSGNAMRRSSDKAISADEGWRKGLGFGQQAAIRALTLPAAVLARIHRKTGAASAPPGAVASAVPR